MAAYHWYGVCVAALHEVVWLHTIGMVCVAALASCAGTMLDFAIYMLTSIRCNRHTYTLTDRHESNYEPSHEATNWLPQAQARISASTRAPQVRVPQERTYKTAFTAAILCRRFVRCLRWTPNRNSCSAPAPSTLPAAYPKPTTVANSTAMPRTV